MQFLEAIGVLCYMKDGLALSLVLEGNSLHEREYFTGIQSKI